MKIAEEKEDNMITDINNMPSESESISSIEKVLLIIKAFN
jgi:hypothetical protein